MDKRKEKRWPQKDGAKRRKIERKKNQMMGKRKEKRMKNLTQIVENGKTKTKKSTLLPFTTFLVKYT